MCRHYASSLYSNYMESASLQSGTTTSNHNSKFPWRKLLYALLWGLVLTTGLSQFSQESDWGFHVMDLDSKIISMISSASALLVIGIGIAKLMRKSFYLNIPTSRFFSGNRSDRKLKIDYRYFFLFRIGYAIISLNCTLPLFLFLISQGISAGGLAQGFIIFPT